MSERTLARTTAAAVLALVAALLQALVAPAAQAQEPVLPTPTGPHPVGSAVLHLVDEARADPWKPDRRRELMVTVWYPARDVAGRPRAPYTGAESALGYPFGGLPLAGATGNSYAGAPVDDSLGAVPTVLFSPGYGTARDLYSVMAEELASRGFAVVTMDHTFETPAVAFPGGRVEYADPAVLGDESMVDVRVADSRFVLDDLSRIVAGENPDAEHAGLPAGLARALDLDRVGMFGHSYGGYTAVETMRVDARIDAVVDLDGAIGSDDEPVPAVTEGMDRPVLLMASGATYRSRGGGPVTWDPTWGPFLSNHRGWVRALALLDSGHFSYSDLPVFIPLAAAVLPSIRDAAGVGSAERAIAVQREYVPAMFDRFLRDRDGALLDGPTPRFPDVLFWTR
ncbi:alpha/beta hydrolase family protein [Rhodococcus sp. NPDC127528]|uniref:alpha/beta hydrolase family protein n=1 Tax=unclassified Rhodococcus (in: high G+C Gram-positive bacteria) TaxID=192944 RepID=UPI00362E5C6C